MTPGYVIALMVSAIAFGMVAIAMLCVRVGLEQNCRRSLIEGTALSVASFAILSVVAVARLAGGPF